MTVQIIKDYLEAELAHVDRQERNAQVGSRKQHWLSQKRFINQMLNELADVFGNEAPESKSEFQRDLASAINRNSKENGSGTPDFVLAQFLEHALDAFDYAVRYRASTRE